MKTSRFAISRRCLAMLCGVALISLSAVGCNPKTAASSQPESEVNTTVSASDSTTSQSAATEDTTGSEENTTATEDTEGMTTVTTRIEEPVETKPNQPETGNTVAEVKVTNGIPRLYVGGKRREPIYFMPPHYDFTSNESLNAEMEYAAKYQVDLIIYPYGLDYHDTPRFFNSTLKGVIENMLSYNPDAYLILRLDMTGSLEKLELNSKEAAWLNGKETGYPSMASDVWYQTARQMLKNIVDNVMSDEYLSKYVIGFEFLGGNSGEWFEYDYWEGNMDTSECNRQGFVRYLKNKYKTDAALRAAWNDQGVTLDGAALPNYSKLPGINNDGNQGDKEFLMLAKEDQIYVDYLDYLGSQRAERLGGFADVVKAASKNTKLAITYYGYHCDTPTASSAHFAVNKLLSYKSIDMLSGPVSYSDRNDGGIGAYMGFTDSVTAAGKMWMDEGDYRSPIHTIKPTGMEYPATTKLMDQVMRREVAKCMIFNTGVWWLDLQGAGWFNYESFWKKNETMMNLMYNYNNVQKKKTPEVCLILDESAMSLLSSAQGYASNGLIGARASIYKSGYDFGMYLIDDVINGKVDDAKVYVFLNPWRLTSQQVAALEKKVHRPGKTSLYMYGSGLTSEADFKKLTGMTVHSAKANQAQMTTVKLEEGLNKGIAKDSMSVNPVYYVDGGSGVKALGSYIGSEAKGKLGLASYSKDGWTSVFYGGTHLTVDMLAYLGDLAGAHRFSSTQDTLYADSQMVTLHAATAGTKTVRFPTSCDIFNLETGKWSTGNSITMDAYKGQTIILYYGEKSTIRKIVG